MLPRLCQPGTDTPWRTVVSDTVILIPNILCVLQRPCIIVVDAHQVDYVVARVQVHDVERLVTRLLRAGPLDVQARTARLQRLGGAAPAGPEGRRLTVVVDAPG